MPIDTAIIAIANCTASDTQPSSSSEPFSKIDGSSKTIVDADSIYFSYGKVYGDLAFKEVQEVRNDILYLQNLEKCCKSDSIFI